MKTCLILVVLLGISLPAPAAFAQTQDTRSQADSLYWEKVLSAYGEFCQTAMSARSGDRPSAGRLRTQADAIKELLRQARGGMTASQQARFASLRQDYSGMNIPDFEIRQSGAPAPEDTAAPPIAPAPQKPKVIVAPGTNTVIRDTITIEKTIIYRDSVKYYNTVERMLEVTPVAPAKVEEQPRPLPDCSFFVLAQMSPVPDLSGGLMAGYVDKFGGYLRYVGNFKFGKTGYDCKSDGTASFGRIWTTGAQKVSTFRATAGLCVKVAPWLVPYVGVGYGERTLAWEDTAGSWARVSDCSFRSVAAEAGLLFKLDRFVLSAGLGTVSFCCCSFDFGAGICF